VNSGNVVFIRGQADRYSLEHFIRKVWSKRNDRHSEIRHLGGDIGAAQEMYRMGG
jgi:hypothetical protein